MRLVTETSYQKLINGDAGYELLLKTSFQINDSIDLKLGLSEGYTAPRSSILSLNHAGVRMDVGVLWHVANDFKVGYTHSARQWFDGASPRSVFMYDSVDIFCIRKEFNITF